MNFHDTKSMLIEKYLGETTSVVTSTVVKLSNKLRSVQVGLRSNDPCIVRDNVTSALTLLDNLSLYANTLTTRLIKSTKTTLKAINKGVVDVDNGKKTDAMTIDKLPYTFDVDDTNTDGDYIDMVNALRHSFSKAGQLTENEEGETEQLTEYDTALRKWAELRGSINGQCDTACSSCGDGVMASSIKRLSAKCKSLMSVIDTSLGKLTPTKYIGTQVVNRINEMATVVSEDSGSEDNTEQWRDVKESVSRLNQYIESFDGIINELSEGNL